MEPLVQLVLLICSLNMDSNRFEHCFLRVHTATDITTCYNQMQLSVPLEPGQVVFTRYCHNLNSPLPNETIFPPTPEDI